MLELLGQKICAFFIFDWHIAFYKDYANLQSCQQYESNIFIFADPLVE